MTMPGIIKQFVVGSVLVVGMITVAGCRPPTPSSKILLLDARSALSKGDYDRAEQLAERVPESSEESNDAAAIAGEAAFKAGRIDKAVSLYLALAERQHLSRQQPLGLFYAAEVCRDAGRLTDADRNYRKLLVDVPDNAASHERLAFLLSTTGRRWESLPHYFFLARSGTASVLELVLMADLDRPIEQRPFLEDCHRKSPHDKLVQLGLAAHALWEGNQTDAQSQLQSVLTAAPDLIAGQAMLGELLVNKSRRQFLDWHRKLPSVAESHPDIWYVCGLFARKQNHLRVAARCFWESIRLAPTHRRATFQLGQVLRALDAPSGETVEARAKQLIQLTQILDEVLRNESGREDSFRKVATLLEDMGRIWEACAWGVIARQRFPQAE